MANQTYQLIVRTGPQPNQVFPLESKVLTIGRDPLSDIVIDDSEVSRHHSKLTRDEGGYSLQDMGSTNGTFIDGQRLGGEAVMLNPGQVLMLGSNVTLVYQTIDEPDPLATVVAPAAVLPGVPEQSPVSTDDENSEESSSEQAIVEDSPLVVDVNLDEEAAIPEPEQPEVLAEVEEVAVQDQEGEAEPFVEEILSSDETEEGSREIEDATVMEIESQVTESEEPEIPPTIDQEDYSVTMIEAIPPAVQIEPSEQDITPSTEDSAAASDVIEPAWEVNEVDSVGDQMESEDSDSVVEEGGSGEIPEEIEMPAPAPPAAAVPDYSLDEDITSIDIPKKEEAPIIDSGEPLPPFEYETEPQPPMKEARIVEDKGGKSNRNRNIIIGIAVLFLLMCCCLILSVLIAYLFIPTSNF